MQRKRFNTRTCICSALALLLLTLAICLTACGTDRGGDETETETDPPHVHEIAEWTVTREATLLENGERQGVCTGCGETLTEPIRCVTADLPRIYLTGDMTGISKDDKVTLAIEYVSDGLCFSGYTSMDVQGGSSAGYVKKNYNIRLYEDETLDKKLKVDVGFGKESKYCLKANFIDATHARNIVTARMWGEMIATRKNVPEKLAETPNGGAVDGFPVLLFHDGEWMGVYTMNIPKDEWMFGIGKKDTGALLFMDQWSDAGQFAALPDETGSNWEVKYESEDLEGKSMDLLTDLTRFVIEASDEEFAAHIDEYIDVPSVIDYVLLICASQAEDNTSKNMMLVTYDGKKFYASVYDLDSTWGLHWDGTSFEDPKDLIPVPYTYNGKTVMYPGTGNRLLVRVLTQFSDEFVARYRELRHTVFAKKHVTALFEEFAAGIPTEALEADWALYPDIPSTKTNTIERICGYQYDKHFSLMDHSFAEYERQTSE